MTADAVQREPSRTRRSIRDQAVAAQAVQQQLRLRWMRRRGLAVVVMAAAPALVVPLSMPLPLSAVANPETSSASSLRPQSLSVGDLSASTADRDGYVAGPLIPGGSKIYAYTADTFVNDPSSAVQWPFTQGVPISSPYGNRIPPCPSCSAFHTGVDLTPGIGTPIQAMADGVVTAASDDGGSYGTYVTIQHEIDGQPVESLYAHMYRGSIPLKVGDYVRVGQLVGLVGSTGQSTGAHLHFALRVASELVDPLVWLPPRVRS